MTYLQVAPNIATMTPRFHAKILDAPKPPFLLSLRRRVWGWICRALLAVLDEA